MVARTDDMAQARAAMDRSLAWHDHLFAAGEYEAAGEIVTAVCDILDRWGERDRAKALLRGSIATLEGGNKAVAQGNLATLLRTRASWPRRWRPTRQVYRRSRGAGGRQQMAATLGCKWQCLSEHGRVRQGHREAGCQRWSSDSEIGDEEGQAISLHQLSMLYRLKEDYAAALARSQEAETLNRKLGREVGVARTLHEQGLIHNGLARAAATGDEADTTAQAAIDRFTGKPGDQPAHREPGRRGRHAGRAGQAAAWMPDR